AYKYKVDYTRVNEFGQGGDEEELEVKVADKPLSAPPDADASVKVGGEDEALEVKAPEVKASVDAHSGKSGQRRRK
ncbi:hypothetical protein LTR28_010030, partial [Elasticomyces elasticus]